MNDYHIPVLKNEAICSLNIKSGKKYIDATLGGGGHTEEILQKGGIVLGIDTDNESIEYVRKRLAAFLVNLACPGPQRPLRTSVPKLGAFSPNTKQLILAKGNFSEIEEIAKRENFSDISGILYDLGVSTHQLEKDERGFSFNKNAILDMRMDQELKVKALDLINGLNANELYELFKKFGEENNSWAIVRNIISARSIKPISTTNELASIVIRAKTNRGKYDRTHPATRIFQALRIVVNDELNNLKTSLPDALKILNNNGRLVVISFHSLEDRIVKNFFKEEEIKNKLKILTKHPIRPGEKEIKSNPRSRSAKLRVSEKIL